jgi:DNA repair exonuclease SbcCD nuclease subunit
VTRIAFVTDQHFDAHNDLEETVRVHNWIADDARARGCQATLLGGDAFEKRSVPADRNALGAWLLRLACFGPVVGVDGNHEVESDMRIFNDLGGEHAITIYDRACSHVIPHLGLVIGCVPWPHLGPLLARIDGGSTEEAHARARAAMRDVFTGIGAEMDLHPSCARIGLAHLMLSGARTDHDQPVRGAELTLATSDLAAMRAAVYLLGHIHAQQEIPVGDVRGYYGGCPEHANFGEPGEKGYLVVRTDGPRIVEVTRVPTPVAPMILAQGAFSGGALTNTYAHRNVAGADVRFQFTFPVDQREPARAAAEDIKRELLARGARSVTFDEVVETQTRSLAPEVARAVGHIEKLEAHWASINFDPGSRRAALLAKADQLHEATSEA